MFLTAMKNTDDRNDAGFLINAICDHGAPAVVGHTQPLADVVARHSSKWEGFQVFASTDHGVYVALSHRD